MSGTRVILRSGVSFVVPADVSRFVTQYREMASGMPIDSMLADNAVGFLIRNSEVAAIIPEAWETSSTTRQVQEQS